MAAVAIKSTTQEHLDILDIKDDVVLLKDGGVALVLQVSAVNFDLLSEEEQEAIIYAYAGLLNSLTFPIQIVIRSQRKDISNYLELLKTQENASVSLKRKTQIQEYRQFVSQIVKEGNILDKKFYCVIPFSRVELGLHASNPLSLKKNQSLPYDKAYILNKALTTLHPKRDHLIRQFARVGLFARQLNTQELTQLYYNAYNPDQAKEKSLTGSERYDSPIVQSRLDFQKIPPTQPFTPPADTTTQTLEISPTPITQTATTPPTSTETTPIAQTPSTPPETTAQSPTPQSTTTLPIQAQTPPTQTPQSPPTPETQTGVMKTETVTNQPNPTP